MQPCLLRSLAAASTAAGTEWQPLQSPLGATLTASSFVPHWGVVAVVCVTYGSGCAEQQLPSEKQLRGQKWKASQPVQQDNTFRHQHKLTLTDQLLSTCCAVLCCLAENIILLGMWIFWCGMVYYSQSSIADMKPFDPFEILNIPRDASDREIAKAYRKLSLLYHPDKVGVQAGLGWEGVVCDHFMRSRVGQGYRQQADKAV